VQFAGGQAALSFKIQPVGCFQRFFFVELNKSIQIAQPVDSFEII